MNLKFKNIDVPRNIAIWIISATTVIALFILILTIYWPDKKTYRTNSLNLNSSKVSEKVKDLPTSTPQTIKYIPNTLTVRLNTSYDEIISSNLNSNISIKKISKPEIELPENIHEKQILNYFQLGDVVFALAMKGSMNFYLNLPTNFNPTFTGVLIAKIDDKNWSTFISLNDSKTDKRNNPYYMWSNSNKLLISIVDQNGAGSGEGVMKLISYPNNNDWQLAGCYYFGGSYNSPDVSGDYFEYSSKLYKQRELKFDSCDFVKFIKN